MATWSIRVNNIEVCTYDDLGERTDTWSNWPEPVLQLPEVISTMNGKPWAARHVDGDALIVNIEV